MLCLLIADIYVTLTIQMRYSQWPTNTNNNLVQGHFHKTPSAVWVHRHRESLHFFFFYWANFAELFFFASICILPSALCALSRSHLSPLNVPPVERCCSWEGCSLQTVGNRSIRHSDVLLLWVPSGSLQLFSVYLPHVSRWLHALN